MNRRSFLAALGLAPVVAAVPALAVEPPAVLGFHKVRHAVASPLRVTWRLTDEEAWIGPVDVLGPMISTYDLNDGLLSREIAGVVTEHIGEVSYRSPRGSRPGLYVSPRMATEMSERGLIDIVFDNAEDVIGSSHA